MRQLASATRLSRFGDRFKKVRALITYGIVRKCRATWHGLRNYLRYRSLPQRTDPTAGKTILIMDHYISRPEDSTLGRSNAMYDQLLCQMGWRVLLMPYAPTWDNLNPDPHGTRWDEPYADQLRQQGIGVLAGWLFRRRRQAWLQRNAAQIDYVLFRSLDAAEAYLPFFRAHAQAKLIFLSPNVKALHHQREYEATGNGEALKRAKALAIREDAMFRAADALLTRSYEEKQWLCDRYGHKVFQMPLFFYQSLLVAQPTLPPGQQLLFVGNFRHRPNPDGMGWFVQTCFPHIMAQCPAVRLVIVGSLVTAEILALQSEHISIFTKVSDAELTTLYQQARVAIVPLRFGAGVKGKVLEALAHGVPVVTTRFGVEGVAGLRNIIPPMDTPAEMTAAITHLLTDDLAWQQTACTGQHFVQQHFSVQAAQTTMTQLFAALEASDFIHA